MVEGDPHQGKYHEPIINHDDCKVINSTVNRNAVREPEGREREWKRLLRILMQDVEAAGSWRSDGALGRGPSLCPGHRNVTLKSHCKPRDGPPTAASNQEAPDPNRRTAVTDLRHESATCPSRHALAAHTSQLGFVRVPLPMVASHLGEQRPLMNPMKWICMALDSEDVSALPPLVS